MVRPMTREKLEEDMISLERRIDGILMYIKNNPTSDPNAYEMNDVMFEVSAAGFFGRKFETEPYGFSGDKTYKTLKSKFSKMMEYRLPQLISEEQGLNATNLYEYFQASLMHMATLNKLYDSYDQRNLFNSVCGVNLYIHQRSRDLMAQNRMSEPIYDNAREKEDIILAYDEYKENAEDEPRPYHGRDDSLDKLCNEIQNSYNKSLNEISLESNGMKK